MKKYFKITVFVNLFLIMLCIESCSVPDQKVNDDKDKYVIPDSLLKTLVIDTVNTSPFISSVTLTGKVSFNDDNVVKIYPMVSGNIQDIKVALGDYVKAGQTLAIIKSSEME